LIAVELVAQTAAAVSAWREHDQGEDHTGYIAGIKEARFHIDHFRVGDALTTEAMCPHLMNNNNTLYGVFHGRVFHGDRTAAEVSVQIVRPPKSGGRKKG
jgi:predicted hotdog family 3-hydroxylacyl-ACP dehydratase